MTRKPKVQRKRVKALTDPQPEFVSLVTAGANMTPFRALKADGIEEAAPTTAADTTIEQTESVDAAKADTHDIKSIVFVKTAFADVAAVKAWLSDGGYDDTGEIKETDDSFIVGDEDEQATKIEYTGVTVYVVPKAVPEKQVAITPESQPTAVTAVTPVAKADTPVVATERVAKSMYAIPALIELVSALKWIVEELSYEASGDEGEEYAPVVSALKESASSMLTGLSTLFNLEVGELETEFRAAAPVAEPVVEPVAKEAADDATVAVVEPTTEATTAAEPAVVADDAETQKTVIEPEAAVTNAPDLVALVTSLATQVQQLTDSIGNLHNQTAAKDDALADRVSAIESERQSRKGADEDDFRAGSAGVKKQDPSGIAELSLRSALGIRRRGS